MENADSSLTEQKRKGFPPLAAATALAVVFVGAKAAGLEPAWSPGFPHRLLVLTMVSFSDVLFAIALGLLGDIVLRLTRPWPRVTRFVRTLFLITCTLCAIYAVAAIGFFRYFNRPLTFELLRLVGNAAVIRSSITERLTGPLIAGLITVPMLFLIAARAIGRFRPVITVLFGVAVLWIAVGWTQRSQHLEDEEIEYRWLSPHVELLRTTFVSLASRRGSPFPKEILEEDVAPFRNFSARHGQPSRGFEIPAGVARPRNTIVIVLESVGTKYLSLYGSHYDTTPSLVAEASNALVFDNIYAHASFTYCSFRSINFSVYPGLPWHYAILPDVRPIPPTLASVMQARGLRTAYINNGNLDWEDERFLLENRGFDAVDDYTKVGCPELSSWGTEDRCLFERLIHWIDEKPADPFFAVCWTDQTHDPYPLSPGVAPIDFFQGAPPAHYAADLSRYLNVVHETDRQIGRLLAALRERGLADDTLVVVTGDHGEAFADPHSQRGHSWTVYEEESHVPLIFWNPRLFAPGRRLDTIGGHVDLNPTLADILDVTPPGEWQGHSLFDPERPNRTFFMGIAGGDTFGVREAEWKYVYDVTSGQETLFNLKSDREERHDAAVAEKDLCRRLRQRVAAWVTFEDAYLWGREN